MEIDRQQCAALDEALRAMSEALRIMSKVMETFAVDTIEDRRGTPLPDPGLDGLPGPSPMVTDRTNVYNWEILGAFAEAALRRAPIPSPRANM